MKNVKDIGLFPFVVILLLAISNAFQVFQVFGLRSENDLLKRGAAIFEPGQHIVKCLDAQAQLSVNVEKEEPLCLTATMGKISKKDTE